MQSTYQPGEWTLLLSRRAIVALPPDAAAPFVATVWERLQVDAGLATVIDALTEQASGSFASMLPFAAAVLENGDVRIAVRGDVSVEVDGIAGTERFSGANVTTWSERFVAKATRVEVVAGGTDAPADGSLPILGGVIRARAVTSMIEPSDAEAPVVSSTVVEDAFLEPVPDSEAETPESEKPAESENPDAPAVPPAPSVPPLVVPVIVPPAPVVATAAPITTPEADADIAPEDVPTESMETIASLDDADDAALLGATVDDSTVVPDEDEDEDEDEDGSTPDAFDLLFGETIHSSPAAGPAGPPPPPPLPVTGDHDGSTISAAEARAMRQTASPVAPDAPTERIPTASGTGRMRVSSGQVVTLDRTVIIGRRPRSTRASGASLPHLVAVDSPQQDISRSHLEVRPEGDTVVVIDLHTTNGSTLLRPGADPVRLHPGEQTLVLSGDTIDLGDGITVLFEDLP